MSEWSIQSLDEVVEYFIDYRGKTPDKKSSGIPLVTAKIVKDGRLQIPTEFISVEDYPIWMTRGYPEVNDVVLTTEAPLGEVALLKDRNVALAQRIITMRGFKNVLENRYLKYWLQSEYGQYELESRASGTTVFGIKSSVLKKVPITVPPFEEQKAIASVLSSLDDKIDLLHRQNKTLESMAEALFRQWFVEESQEDWIEGTLADIVYNVKDNAPTKNISSDDIYVGLEHIERRSISIYKYGNGGDIDSNKSRFSVDDILFGRLRPYFHKVCLAPFSGVCSTDILVLRPRSERLRSFALFAFFQDNVIEFSSIASGGTRMPRIDWLSLGSYPISLPPEDKLEAFETIITPKINKIISNIKQIQTLEKLRDTLLPKLMSGEVRVRYEAEPAVSAV